MFRRCVDAVEKRRNQSRTAVLWLGDVFMESVGCLKFLRMNCVFGHGSAGVRFLDEYRRNCGGVRACRHQESM